MNEPPQGTNAMANAPHITPPDSVSVMLVSAHDWFASALQAVLEPEGFAITRLRSARVAVRDAAQVNPDIVILDEGLPDMDAPALASSLTGGVLKSSVPILVYSPNFWNESDQAAAMRSGAWDIIKEPVRSNLVVAKLRRLLEIKTLIDATEEGSLSDMATGLLNLAGMMRMLRVMGAAARRHGSAVGCAVISPTTAPERETLDAVRERAARLWAKGVRESDVCGWVDETELGVIALGTDAAGLTTMVRRLTEGTAADPLASGLVPLSAGIADLTDRFTETGAEASAPVAPMATRVASIAGIAAARAALREAREAGGGIRIAEIS